MVGKGLSAYAQGSSIPPLTAHTPFDADSGVPVTHALFIDP